MSFQNLYENAKGVLLIDTSICKENRTWIKETLAILEKRLRRKNDLSALDEPCYKTLYGYTQLLRNTNNWFENKPLKKMSEKEFRKRFEKIYDSLEDGKNLTKRGKPRKDKKKYYTKVFRSTPFKIIGKAEIVKDVMEFYSGKNTNTEVRFFEERTFKQIKETTIQPIHKTLAQLAWDIGENINTLLRLNKKHFVRRINEDTNEPEYIVNLPKELLKRSRTPRSEPTLYRETVELLDLVFSMGKRVFIEDGGSEVHKVLRPDGKYKKLYGTWKNIPYSENDKIFNFEYRQAVQVLDRAVKIVGAVVIPSGTPITWKDFRSSMACHLLKQGWSRDEINARLGHKPSSREIDKYINYFALDRAQPKKKSYDSDVKKLSAKIEELESREKLFQQRLEQRLKENENLNARLDELEIRFNNERALAQLRKNK